MILNFPAGVIEYVGRNGVHYVADTNGQADIPAALLSDCLGVGFTVGYLHETVTFGASLTPDMKAGNTKQILLTGNITAVNAPINGVKGQELVITFIQDGTGGRTVGGWNAKYKATWADTGNTANKRSTVKFLYDGANWNQIGTQSTYV